MKYGPIAIMALGLMGCASSQELAARAAKKEAEVSNKHDSYCRSLGTKPGENNYVACRLQLKQIASNELQAAAIVGLHANAQNDQMIIEGLRMARGY